MCILVLRGLDGASTWVATAFDVRWLYLIQVGLALLALMVLTSRYVELVDAPDSRRHVLLSIAVGIGVFVIWIAPIPAWMHQGGIGGGPGAFDPRDAGVLRWDLVAARALGAVLIVPVMEELFWRSFLARWIDRRSFLQLDPKHLSLLAVLASSAVFALAHDLWATGFVAGIAYAALYRQLGKLWYAVIAHATTNLALALWVVREQAWSYW